MNTRDHKQLCKEVDDILARINLDEWESIVNCKWLPEVMDTPFGLVKYKTRIANSQGCYIYLADEGQDKRAFRHAANYLNNQRDMLACYLLNSRGEMKEVLHNSLVVVCHSDE